MSRVIAALLTALAFQLHISAAFAQNCSPRLRALGVPDKPSRERLFSQAGIAEEVSGLDELDRDLLYTRGRYMSFDLWKSKYPNIDETKLRKLKDLLQERHCDGPPRLK